jgi:hypothetical protein
MINREEVTRTNCVTFKDNYCLFFLLPYYSARRVGKMADLLSAIPPVHYR